MKLIRTIPILGHWKLRSIHNDLIDDIKINTRQQVEFQCMQLEGSYLRGPSILLNFLLEFLFVWQKDSWQQIITYTKF